jgi:hypothetical protein
VALARSDWAEAAHLLSALLDGSEAASAKEADDRQAMLDRAYAYAMAERPFAALQDLDRVYYRGKDAGQLQPILEGILLQRGVLHLNGSDEDGYRLLCADAVERAQERKGAGSAAVLRLCVLATQGLPTEPGAVERLASAAEAEGTGSASAFHRREARLGRIGLAYRTNRYEDTVRLSEALLGDKTPDETAVLPSDRAWGALFAAMALSHLGRSEAAHARLAIADVLLARIPSDRAYWAEHSAATILRQEAGHTVEAGQRLATAPSLPLGRP